MPKAPPPGTTTLDDPATARRSRGGSRGRGRGRGRGGHITSRSDRTGSANRDSTASFGAGRGSGGRKSKTKAIESLSFDRDARSAYLTAQPRAGLERRKKSAARREAKEKEARAALRRSSREEKRQRVKAAMARYEAVLDPSKAVAGGEGGSDGLEGGIDVGSDGEWHGFDDDTDGNGQRHSRHKGSKTTLQAYTVQREGIDGEDEGEDEVTVVVTEL